MDKRLYDGITFALTPQKDKQYQVVAMGTRGAEPTELCYTSGLMSIADTKLYLEGMRAVALNMLVMLEGVEAFLSNDNADS